MLLLNAKDPIVPNMGRRLYVVYRKGRRVGNLIASAICLLRETAEVVGCGVARAGTAKSR